MQFGEWLIKTRQERGLELQGLSAMTGVNASTINRVEHNLTQVTLITAVRLCEGLEVLPTDLMRALKGQKRLLVLREAQGVYGGHVLTLEDVEAFVAVFHSDPERVRQILTDLLDQAAQEARRSGHIQSEFVGFATSDIDRLLIDSPFYTFELRYPARVDAQMILEILKRGGILMPADIGQYLGKVRQSKQLTQTNLQSAIKLSPSRLSRLESGSVDMLKLNDVLTLEEALGGGGEIVAMCWNASKFISRFPRSAVARKSPEAGGTGQLRRDYKLAQVLIVAWRWLQLSDPGDEARLRVFRRQIERPEVDQ